MIGTMLNEISLEESNRLGAILDLVKLANEKTTEQSKQADEVR